MVHFAFQVIDDDLGRGAIIRFALWRQITGWRWWGRGTSRYDYPSARKPLKRRDMNQPFFSQHALNTLLTDLTANNRLISSLNPAPAGSFEKGSGNAKRGSTLAWAIRSPRGWNLVEVVVRDSIMGITRNRGSTGTWSIILPPVVSLNLRYKRTINLWFPYEPCPTMWTIYLDDLRYSLCAIGRGVREI